MITISLRLPDSVHQKVRELADRDGISVDQFLSTAAAEKVAALLTADYLEQRAARGSRETLHEILAKVPAVEPDPEDRL